MLKSSGIEFTVSGQDKPHKFLTAHRPPSAQETPRLGTGSWGGVGLRNVTASSPTRVRLVASSLGCGRWFGSFSSERGRR